MATQQNVKFDVKKLGYIENNNYCYNYDYANNVD